MCGIGGILTIYQYQGALKRIIQQMQTGIRHRSPDGLGIYILSKKQPDCIVTDIPERCEKPHSIYILSKKQPDCIVTDIPERREKPHSIYILSKKQPDCIVTPPK